MRWDVAQILGRPHLADALAADLSAHPDVTAASANAVTGSLLLTFTPTIDVTRAAEWVRDALLRQLDAMVATGSPLPAAVPKPSAPSAAQTPLQRFIASTDRHRTLRRRAFVCSVANGAEEAVPPLLVGLAADTVTRGSASLLGSLGLRSVGSRLFALGGVSVAFWAAASLIEYMKERATADLANAVRHDLRNQVYQHMQTLDVSTIESRDVSAWMAILDQDVNQIHSFIRQGVDPFFNMGSNLVIVGATCLAVSPTLALTQLLLLPPLVLASMALLKPIRQRHMAARDDAERLNAIFTGNVQGMATIASFGTETIEANRVLEASIKHRDSARIAERVEAVYVPSLRAIAGGGFVTTLVWGGARVANGTLSVGALDAMALTQLRLLSALARMGVGLDQYQKTANALNRIYSTLDARPAITTGTVALPPRRVQGDLGFRNVTFGYDPSRPVLRDLTLECGAGQTIGIVGATGAGKSTLLKLLLRFYDPQQGEVTIDGHDARALVVQDLRESIAMVSQQITLFAGTVRDNIAYGRPEATDADIMAAARVAEAHDFISELPGGYLSRIGFGGLTLSGGQRQRIAIARAVLADRPILLFDEATSALDHATEAALQRSLATVTAGRTTVIVAHRLSTIRHADVIYVLDDGTVRESGTHDELVKARGLYAGMWMVQTGETRPARRHGETRTP